MTLKRDLENKRQHADRYSVFPVPDMAQGMDRQEFREDTAERSEV